MGDIRTTYVHLRQTLEKQGAKWCTKLNLRSKICDAGTLIQILCFSEDRDQVYRFGRTE
jgi:hypothetical protein